MRLRSLKTAEPSNLENQFLMQMALYSCRVETGKRINTKLEEQNLKEDFTSFKEGAQTKPGKTDPD